MSEEDQTGLQGSEQRAIRLTFAYDGDVVRLVSSRRVATLAPSSDPLEGYEGEQGSWVEVRDASGITLHRRVVHDPVRRDAEIFPEELGQPITRVPVERPAGVFSVLVPDIDGADHLALMSSAPARPGVLAAAELIRVRLGQGGERDEERER